VPTTQTARPVPSQLEFWNSYHQRTQRDRDDPERHDSRAAFIEAIGSARSLDVLEIGCGKGHDAVQFALNELRVWALDHSSVALESASDAARMLGAQIEFICHDTAVAFPFSDRAFDGVYAHLSLHYFDNAATRSIFRDILRLTKPGGIFTFSVRSVLDPLYGQGDIVGKDMYCLDGHIRHFFNPDYTRELLAGWELISLNSYETSFSAANPGSFIRAVARRPRKSGRTARGVKGL